MGFTQTWCHQTHQKVGSSIWGTSSFFLPLLCICCPTISLESVLNFKFLIPMAFANCQANKDCFILCFVVHHWKLELNSILKDVLLRRHLNYIDASKPYDRQAICAYRPILYFLIYVWKSEFSNKICKGLGFDRCSWPIFNIKLA